MMYYLNSKTFQNYFLVNERDKDILNAQYVIISTRITVRDKNNDNIVLANMLFPDAYVCESLTDEDFEDRYMEQLDDNKVFIATLIEGSIKEKFNIIFICTKNEWKLHYLEYISNYIYLKFKYPVYDYKYYCTGCKLLRYNKRKIIKKCDKILKKAQEHEAEQMHNTDKGRKVLMKSYYKMSDNELKDILKENDMYKKNMKRQDMLDIISYLYL